MKQTIQVSKEQEIIDGNKLIAEFLYVSIDENGKRILDEGIVKDYFGNTLKYHSSWDWLMPVVEKIASINPDHEFKFEIGKTFCRSKIWDLDDGRSLYEASSGNKDAKTTIWNTCVLFIKWYNSNPQTK